MVGGDKALPVPDNSAGLTFKDIANAINVMITLEVYKREPCQKT